MWTRLGKAVLAALLVVIVAELSARAVMGRVRFAHSYDEPRNPNFRRAWPAFTEPRPRGEADRLVILISNSQGYAPELLDGSACYAHQLEVLLNESDPSHNHIVANWSIGGGSSPEMLLLSARAIDHDPDLLIIASHTEPFTFNRVRMDPSFFISDVNVLAYVWSVRERLLLRDRWRLYPPDLGLLLEAHSGLIQFRGAFVEHRERRWVPRQQNPDRDIRARRETLSTSPRVKEPGRRMLDSIVRTFRAARPDTPVMLVSMPLCRPKWAPRSWPILHGFGDLMAEVVAEGFPGDGHITVLNAVSAVDDGLFLTHTHMRAEGHAAFAGYLLPYVEAGLGGVSTASEGGDR